MWICPKCHVDVEPSFEVCWSCGTTIEGVEDPSFVTADDAVPIVEPASHVPLDSKGDDPVDQELPEPPLSLVECYRARDAAEATFLVDLLAEQGIPAVANGTSMGNTEYVIPLFSPRVEVRSNDFDRARKVVADFEGRRKARRADAKVR